MVDLDNDLEASKRRHEALTQLQVTHSLRQDQRAWFAGLRERAAAGDPFVIAGANTPHEILEAMDIAFMTDVWYSGLVAARRQSAHYSSKLAERGYHGGLNRYAALTLSVSLEDEPEKPWGGFPTPCFIMSAPADRTSQLLAEHYDIPHYGIEKPIELNFNAAWWESSRWDWEQLEGPDRIDMVEAQFREIVATLERVTGRRMDMDRLSEVVSRANQQNEYIDQVRGMIATSPKLPVRLSEAMSQIMGIQWRRGTEWAVNQARMFRDEVAARVEAEAWVAPNERVRLAYIGLGLWQQLDFFTEFEESHGAVFVRSNYVSVPGDLYIKYGEERDPLRTLAARYVTFNDRLHLPPGPAGWAVEEARTHRLSGAIQLQEGYGQKFIERSLEDAGVPVLSFPTDAVDGLQWDGPRMRALVSEFIEQRASVAAERLWG